MHRHFTDLTMLPSLFALFLGCNETKSQDTDTATVDTAQEDTATEDSAEDTAVEELSCHEVSAFVNWNENTIDLSFLLYDESAAYFFGLAQSGTISNRWTGEDCLYGFSYDGQDYLYCHPAQRGISLSYGASYDEVSEGISTHFAGPEFAEEITYIIKDTISNCCWVWGHDPSYYGELNCTTINQ